MFFWLYLGCFESISPKFQYVVAETVLYKKSNINFSFTWWDHGQICIVFHLSVSLLFLLDFLPNFIML